MVLGVFEYRMVISERRGLVYGRRERRQRAKGYRNDLEMCTRSYNIIYVYLFSARTNVTIGFVSSIQFVERTIFPMIPPPPRISVHVLRFLSFIFFLFFRN